MRLITNQNRDKSTWWDDLFQSTLFSNARNLGMLRTDISERKENYIYDIDIPGHMKEDIKVKVEDGYLQVSVNGVASSIKSETDETGEPYEYLHQERFLGTCTRSYYVGKVSEKHVRATYHNGVLTIVVPKCCHTTNDAEKYIEIQ